VNSEKDKSDKCLINGMARPKGWNSDKIALFLRILTQNPEGMWIRRIAAEAKVHPSTVTRYIEGILSPLVEVSSLGEKPLIKVVRLKPLVLQKLSEGQSIQQIMRLLELMKKASK